MFLKCLNQIAGEGLSALLAPGPRAVRIAARWFQQENATVMTVHLANYDLRVSTAEESYYRALRAPTQLTPASELRVVVPVPPGFQAIGATWAHLPATEMKPLEFEALRDGVSFTVPRVNAYSFVAVRLMQAPQNEFSGVSPLQPRPRTAGQASSGTDQDGTGHAISAE